MVDDNHNEHNRNRNGHNRMGWFGWFSAAGFVILGLLHLIDLFTVGLWEISAFWTLVVALIAGVGALALYFGRDPTADPRPETTV
jgi:hypothetical protein